MIRKRVFRVFMLITIAAFAITIGQIAFIHEWIAILNSKMKPRMEKLRQSNLVFEKNKFVNRMDNFRK